MSKIKNKAELIPDCLKEERTKRGWSQEELASRAGLDRKTVNRIENARFLPSIETLIAISNALGVSVNVLLGDK